MDRQFNKQDFEKLLRENANQYRMYPSEKVWTGVHSALHSRRKWYRVSALAMLILSVTAISLLVMNYSTDKAVMTELNKPYSLINSSIPSSKYFFDKNIPEFIQPEMSPVLEQTAERIMLPEIKKTNSQAAKIREENKVSVQETSLPELTSNASLPELTSNATFDASEIDPEIENSFLSELNEPDNLPVEKIKSAEVLQNSNPYAENVNTYNAISSLEIPTIVKHRNSGLTAQVYITPTISYRKLTENKNAYSTNSFNNYRYQGLNNLVNHKPASGLEFGVETKYSINQAVAIKSGFQFNINRYDIRAYSSPTEIATVAVSSGYRTSYMSTLSNYRNFSGNNPNWLENFYFQAAIPVGIELTLAERKGFSWGVSGTLQPTYVIGDRAYLISSDYKNYAKFPDLMRRWNLSTGFETFVTYSTGKVKWQTGPHVRYQHLSSYVSGYPVKENLFAVGLKIAATISKN